MDLAQLRNFGVVAHIDAGKTTVSERILFYTGVEHRMGEVHEGTATMDWMDQERERGITISAAVTACDWRGHQLQLIDTPGHVDFTVEVERSLRVLDGAVVVLDAVAGVQPQTETVVRQAKRHQVPLLFLVNKIDRLGADYAQACASIESRLQVRAVPVQLPLGEGDTFCGILDLISEELLSWSDTLGKELVRSEIPEAEVARVAEARDQLCSAVAEADDSLADRYLDAGRLEAGELRAALRVAVRERRLAPVLVAAALRNRGIQPLLDAVVDFLPSPLERAALWGESAEGARVQRLPSPDQPCTALVFKIHHESFGDLHYVRVFSGVLRVGDKLEVARTGERERVGRILQLHADHQSARESAGPGELVALSGLKHAGTGDTLCAPGQRIALEGMRFPEPVLKLTVEPREPSQSEALVEALACLDREDPTLRTSMDAETGQHLLAGMGELHLEVVLHRLRNEFKLEARSGEPQVSYREALREARTCEAHREIPLAEQPLRLKARLQMQPTEGALVELRVEPELARQLGSLAAELRVDALAGESGEWGLPLDGLRVTVKELSWQPAELKPPSGSLLGVVTRAMRSGLAGHTELREPWMDLRVAAPEAFTSSVLADLNMRGAEIQEVDPSRGEIRARVPLAEMFAYATHLRSQTQGKGEFTMSLAGYAAPQGARISELAAKLGISDRDSLSEP
jgi:elongation factor G